MSSFKTQPLTDEQVEDLHARFRAELAARVSKTLPAAIPAVQKAAVDFLKAASQARVTPSDAELLAVQSAGAAFNRASKKIYQKADPFNLLTRLRVHVAQSMKMRHYPAHDFLDKIFEGRDRLYFPLEMSLSCQSESEKKVRASLSLRGYSVTDYKSGYATDAKGKQTYRIGKLLKDDADNFALFRDDPARSGDPMMMVITRRPEDILRMSTGRGWENCMTYGSQNFGYVMRDIARGNFCAYLVSEKDPDIFDPAARWVIRQYKNKTGDTLWSPSRRAYGLSNHIFDDAVRAFIDSLNVDAPYGRYFIDKGAYADAQHATCHLGQNSTAEEVLQALNVPYIVRDDGDIDACGTVDLSNLHLRQLPDLSRVIVRESFFCGGNLFHDLTGAPKEVTGKFLCYSSGLRSLKGCTQKIGGRFLVYDNLLEDLEGGPQFVGDQYDCRMNRLKTLKGAAAHLHHFTCDRNPDLASLEGGPREVKYMSCEKTSILSLDHRPVSCEYIRWNKGLYRPQRDAVTVAPALSP